MNKVMKRIAALWLACLLVFGSFGMAGSAKGNSSETIAPVAEGNGTVTYGLDIYKGGTKLSDGDTLSPGDVVDVQLCFGTDFYVGLITNQVYYDSTYFEPYLDGAVYTDSPVNTFKEASSFIRILNDENTPKAETVDGDSVTFFQTITSIENNGYSGLVNKADVVSSWKQWTPLAWRANTKDNGATTVSTINAQCDMLAEYVKYHFVGIQLTCNGMNSLGGKLIKVPYAPYFSFQLRVKEGADTAGAAAASIFVPIDGAKRSNAETCNKLYATNCPTGVYTNKGVPMNGQGYDLTAADVDFVIGEAVHEHVYGEPVWEWADDYSSATATFTCICGDTQTVTATEIDVEMLTEEACSQNCVVQYVASVVFDGEPYETASEPVTIEGTALEHSFTNYVSDGNATCTADGTKTAYCDYGCGVSDTIEDAGSMIDHSFTNYVSDGNATCTADGTKTAYCDYGCGVSDTIEDAGSATGHMYGEPTWAWADDYSSATATFVCKNCGDVQTVTTTDIDVETSVEAACETDQVIQYYAVVGFSGEFYEDLSDPVTVTGTATGHSFTSYVSDGNATCTADGTKTALCDYGCGASDTITEEGSALGHDFGAWVVTTPATVDAEGEETHTCSRCGATETRVIPKLSDETGALTVSTADTTVSAGDTVTVTVDLDSNPGLVATALTLDYDPGVLTLTDVQAGGMFQSGNITFSGDLDAQPFRILWEDGTARQNHTETGTILTLTFTVREDAAAGDTAITLTYDELSTFDLDFQSISLTISGTMLTVAPQAVAELVTQEGETAVIDNDRGLIYGLDFGVTEDDLRNTYLDVIGNGHLEFEYTAFGFGTGTVVKFINDDTGEIIDTYTIIIFGDLNGDGLLNLADVTDVRSINASMTTYPDDSPFLLAADVTHDGLVNTADITAIRSANAQIATIDQTTVQ